MSDTREENTNKELVRQIEKLTSENATLYRNLQDKLVNDDILGKSKDMERIKSQVAALSKTSQPVLIVGENGNGKKLIASCIHNMSGRSDKPLISIKCSRDRGRSFEYEFFGYERGAFIGAVQTHKGLLEKVTGGTVVIYGLNKLNQEAQNQLIDILSGNGFKRVGGNAVIRMDVRIIAVNEDSIENDLVDGRLSEQLYGFFEDTVIRIPPLRERKTDIVHIANYFTGYYAKIFEKNVNGVATSTLETLLKYHWPCNVAELESAIEAAVVACNEEVIRCKDLPPTLHNVVDITGSDKGILEQKLDILEYESIIEALKRNGGSITQTAKALGLTERMLGLRIKKYGIENKKFT